MDDLADDTLDRAGGCADFGDPVGTGGAVKLVRELEDPTQRPGWVEVGLRLGPDLVDLADLLFQAANESGAQPGQLRFQAIFLDRPRAGARLSRRVTTALRAWLRCLRRLQCVELNQKLAGKEGLVDDSVNEELLGQRLVGLHVPPEGRHEDDPEIRSRATELGYELQAAAVLEHTQGVAGQFLAREGEYILQAVGVFHGVSFQARNIRYTGFCVSSQ